MAIFLAFKRDTTIRITPTPYSGIMIFVTISVLNHQKSITFSRFFHLQNNNQNIYKKYTIDLF